jgi:hypothetical protein
MIEAYGLALAHLSELNRRRDEERARYDRGLAEPVTPRGPGLLTRLGALVARTASFARSMRSPEWTGGNVSAACARSDACDRAAA